MGFKFLPWRNPGSVCQRNVNGAGACRQGSASSGYKEPGWSKNIAAWVFWVLFFYIFFIPLLLLRKEMLWKKKSTQKTLCQLATAGFLCGETTRPSKTAPAACWVLWFKKKKKKSGFGGNLNSFCSFQGWGFFLRIKNGLNSVRKTRGEMSLG